MKSTNEDRLIESICKLLDAVTKFLLKAGKE